MPPRKARPSTGDTPKKVSTPKKTTPKAKATPTSPTRSHKKLGPHHANVVPGGAASSSSSHAVDLETVELNLQTILSHPVDTVKALLFARRYFLLVAGLLALGNLVVGAIIILKVPYTKIDWPAYMQQVDMFLAGERDYSKIEGETGPLVYPALHLYIYTVFHKLLPAGARERPAQWIFLCVEFITFILVSAIYFLAGRTKHVPQWLLIPLVLSKRSHSIYLLRLFNDPFAMVLFYASVVLFMLENWKAASFVWSLALGVKMNILLFLPGLLVILFQYRGFFGVVDSTVIFACVQVGLPGIYFFDDKQQLKIYFLSAFDFGRQFLYEWTVNWKFLSEDKFLSPTFAKILLGAHAATLVAFGLWRWCPVPGGTVATLGRGLHNLRALFQPAIPITQLSSEHMPLVLFTSNLIGMTFARSLHYQFHAWYFHQLPMLLYFGLGNGAPSVLLGCMILLERAWDTFPATPGSSRTLLLVHLAMIAGLWLMGPKPKPAAAKNA